jgi:Fe-S oxidoreductase
MAENQTKKYTYYPGCSSQGAGVHLDRSLHAIGRKLGYELASIRDWNCCGASVGQASGGPLAQMSLSGRNLALAQEQGGSRDVVTPCAACYLNTHWVNEKLKADEAARGRVNEASMRRLISPPSSTTSPRPAAPNRSPTMERGQRAAAAPCRSTARKRRLA